MTDLTPRLIIETDAGPLLSGELSYIATMARLSPDGELFPFTYQPPLDPENPDEIRPVRRARLVIQELGELPEVPNVPVRRQNSDGSWGVEMVTPAEWMSRRPKEMDQ